MFRGAPSPCRSLLPLHRKAPGKEERCYWCCWGFWPLCGLHIDWFFCASLPKRGISCEGCQEAIAASQLEQGHREECLKASASPCPPPDPVPGRLATQAAKEILPPADSRSHPTPGATWPRCKPEEARRTLRMCFSSRTNISGVCMDTPGVCISPSALP